MKRFIAIAGVLLASVVTQPLAARAETIKIAIIEGLSGPFAANGLSAVRELEFAAENFFSDATIGDEKLDVEIISLDGQVNPKESLVQLRRAISQGVTFIFHGNSSGVAHALVDAVNKHNRRNPDSRVLYLNFSAVDPALTNDECSFWHFRFDGNADMKMNAITEAIREQADVKSVYIIGQDYSFGKAVSAAAKKYLAEKRPDIEIVGDELHPIGKVKDFTPYVQKIQSSGANAIITGNWGSDMVNLAKAVGDLGVNAEIFTFYAVGTGITGTIGASGRDKVFVVAEGHFNPPNTEAWSAYLDAFKAKYPNQDLLYPRMVNTVRMLRAAIEKAGSVKPVDVAHALEGAENTTLAGDVVHMRAEDHQLLMPLQIDVHTDKDIQYDYDRSGFGIKTVTSIPSDANMTPTTCQMKRP